MDERIPAAEAAARLGVKRETLYAYVSRGLLESRSLDGKTSTFDPAEIDALHRSRSRPRTGRLDTTIVSALTHVEQQRVLVRGHDLVELASSGARYEAVASLLWTGDLQPVPRWQRNPETSERARLFQAALPADAPLIDRLRANVLAAGAADALRSDTRPSGVLHAAPPLIAAMVDGLPGARERDSPIAERLWPALTAMRATRHWVDALNTALIVVADHDLAASTFAARIAASTRADIYSVVLAALGAFAGPYHGAASVPVRDLLETAATRGAGPAIAAHLVNDSSVPGFGHFQYPDGDPRAVAVLDAVRAAKPARHRIELCEEVLDLTRKRTGIEPNVDYAIATSRLCTQMSSDAGEGLFAIARTAGWIAHALEEYQENPLRFRPVTRYVGH